MINPVVYSISLDVHKIGSQKVLSMVRFDTKRTVVVSLTENGRPYVITEGCTAVFTAKKPDGTVIYNDCGIDYVNNTIVYHVTAQTTAVNGRVDCQLRLIGREGNIISSPTFTIVVADTLFNEGRIVDSSDEFNKLTAYIAGLEERAAAGEFDGKSIYIKGSVPSVADLEEKVSTAEAGDSYLTSDGHLHVFDGTSFVDTGRLQGDRGESGVYVGSGDPPDDCNVQIDPDGDCVTVDDVLDENSNGVVKNKVVAKKFNEVDGEIFDCKAQISSVAGDLNALKNKVPQNLLPSELFVTSASNLSVEGLGEYRLFAFHLAETTDIVGEYINECVLLLFAVEKSDWSCDYAYASMTTEEGVTYNLKVIFDFYNNTMSVERFDCLGGNSPKVVIKEIIGIA